MTSSQLFLPIFSFTEPTISMSGARGVGVRTTDPDTGITTSRLVLRTTSRLVLLHQGWYYYIKVGITYYIKVSITTSRLVLLHQGWYYYIKVGITSRLVLLHQGWYYYIKVGITTSRLLLLSQLFQKCPRTISAHKQLGFCGILTNFPN